MVRDHDTVGQGGVGVMAKERTNSALEIRFMNASKECPPGRKIVRCGPESGYSDFNYASAPRRKPAGLWSAVLNPGIES